MGKKLMNIQTLSLLQAYGLLEEGEESAKDWKSYLYNAVFNFEFVEYLASRPGEEEKRRGNGEVQRWRHLPVLYKTQRFIQSGLFRDQMGSLVS